MTTASLSSRPNILPAASELASTENAANARLAALPKTAQQKFERLRQLETRMSALRDGLYDQQQRVREARDVAHLQLASFDRQMRPEATFEYKDDSATGTRTRVPVSFPERERIVQRIESYKAELARLVAEQTAANLGFSTADILDWLARSSAKYIAAPVPLVKINKGESFADALKRTRDAQATLHNELAAVENAGRTVTETKAAMRAEVALLAEKGRPGIANLFHGGSIEWPSEVLVANGQHQYAVSTTIKDAFSLAVWAHRAAIVSQLDAEIERSGDDATALSAEAQATRVAELQAALFQLQRHEEAIVERLESEGVQVRRTCVDPLILLGIEQPRQ